MIKRGRLIYGASGHPHNSSVTRFGGSFTIACRSNNGADSAESAAPFAFVCSSSKKPDVWRRLSAAGTNQRLSLWRPHDCTADCYLPTMRPIRYSTAQGRRARRRDFPLRGRRVPWPIGEMTSARPLFVLSCCVLGHAAPIRRAGLRRMGRLSPIQTKPSIWAKPRTSLPPLRADRATTQP